MLPLPEDETTWDQYNLMFATSHGTVRRNLLSDFANIRSNGLIAMKLEDDERLIAVSTCTDDQDVLLATRDGKCIRFRIPEVRIFAGRTSTGVRGIKLMGDDEIISMSILTGVTATPDERAAYIKLSRLKRGMDENAAPEEPEDDGVAVDTAISTERAAELEALEQFILTVSERGFGKRTSAYEYRTTGRGGQGIQNMEVNDRNGRIVATFPIGANDGLMLVSDGGQVIRTSVKDVRIAGRRTQGVTLFKVAAEEKVVSVARIDEESSNDDDAGDIEENGGPVEGTDPSSLPLE